MSFCTFLNEGGPLIKFIYNLKVLLIKNMERVRNYPWHASFYSLTITICRYKEMDLAWYSHRCHCSSYNFLLRLVPPIKKEKCSTSR